MRGRLCMLATIGLMWDRLALLEHIMRERCSVFE
jgi:hypothetical protein